MGNICLRFIRRFLRWICSCGNEYDEFQGEQRLRREDQLEQEVARLNNNVHELEENLRAVKEENERNKQHNEQVIDGLQTKVRALQDDYDKLQRKNDKEKKHNVEISRELAATHEVVKNLRSENGDLKLKISSTIKAADDCREAAAAEYEKYKRERNEIANQLESANLKLVTLESERNRLKSEFDRMSSQLSKEMMYYKEQLKSKEKELAEEREKFIESQYKQQDYNMAQQEALEREKENMSAQAFEKVIQLENKLTEEAANKLRIVDDYQKAKEKIHEENSKAMSDLRSTYERLLTEKDQEIKSTRQDIIKMRKEYDSRLEQLAASMKKELEASHARFASAAKGSDEQAEFVIRSMYNDFNNVLERQAKQLHEAHERERMLRTNRGFYNNIYEEEEDEKTEGVQIEEVFD